MELRKPRILVAMIAITALLAGCSGERLDSEDVRFVAIESFGETTEFQQAILDDRILTFEEYESALVAAVRCIEDLQIDDLTVVGPFPSERDGRVLEFYTEWEGQMPMDEYEEWSERKSQLVLQCEHEYSVEVQRAWESQL